MRVKSAYWKKFIAMFLLSFMATGVGFWGTPLALSAPLAENRGSLMGIITDAEGVKALDNSIVHLRSPVTGKIYKSAPSDHQGMYKLRGVPWGTFDMAVETEEGFFLAPEQIAIAKKSPQFVSIALNSDRSSAAAASKFKSAAFWTGPAGAAIIIAGALLTGFLVSEWAGDEEEESPLNP
jgi:hypothetical protein